MKTIAHIEGAPLFGWNDESTKQHLIENPLSVGDPMIIYNGQAGFDMYELAEVLNPDSGRQHRVVLSKAAAWGGRSFYRSGRNCHSPTGQSRMLPPVPDLMEHLTLERGVCFSAIYGVDPSAT